MSSADKHMSDEGPGLLARAVRASRLKAARAVKDLLGYDRFMERRWRERNPFAGTPNEWGHTFQEGGPKVGILSDRAHGHRWLMAACHSLEVDHVVIDPHVDGWLRIVTEGMPDLVMATPFISDANERAMWDERAWAVSKLLGLPFFPEPDLVWLYESKRRTAEWLNWHGYPHLPTHTFFSRDRAEEFVANASFPMMAKLDQGAAAAGVRDLPDRKSARRYIRRAFGRGLGTRNQSRWVRHRGYVVFQEMGTVTAEWRLIRIGKRVFTKRKRMAHGRFSGSGKIEWADPPREILERTYEIASRHGWSCVNLDWFELSDGSFAVNEIHAVWGNRDLPTSPHEGWFEQGDEGKWQFRKGVLHQNQFANLRVEESLRSILHGGRAGR